MLVALFGVLALGALTAAAAQAVVPAPRWSIEKTTLEAGKTHYISIKAYAPFKLKSGGVVIECKATKLIEGSLLGSAPGSAGKDNEVIEFTECTVSGTVGGKTITNCTVNEPIRTNPIKSELVETEKAEPEKAKGSLLTLFEPAEGSTFATLTFTTGTGGVCPPTTKVTGKVAGQVLTDPNKPPELGTLVTLESGATEATSWLINLPATPIKKVTKINNEKVTEVEKIGLEFASEPATLEGTALILLAKKNTTTGLLESEPTTKWSPLP